MELPRVEVGRHVVIGVDNNRMIAVKYDSNHNHGTMVHVGENVFLEYFAKRAETPKMRRGSKFATILNTKRKNTGACPN